MLVVISIKTSLVKLDKTYIVCLAASYYCRNHDNCIMQWCHCMILYYIIQWYAIYYA